MKKFYLMAVALSLPLMVLTIVFSIFAVVEPVQAAPVARPLYATCTVNTTADSGGGSLRACLQSAGSGDTIVFDAGAFPLASPATIALITPLPIIITNNVTIDGSNAGVILNGSGITGEANGLVINGADYVTIKGLQILNFTRGIELNNDAKDNTIGGINASPGGDCSGDCNLISGNSNKGITIGDSGTMSNTVSGNYIGTNLSGTQANGNDGNGISIEGASYNVIGGSTPGERNLISGNAENGITIIGNGTMSNTVIGNYIGTNVNGTAAIANEEAGIYITNDATYNVIGGTTSSERNLLSGNWDDGVEIEEASNNTVIGNYIGTNVDGTAPIPNSSTGVRIREGASHNLIKNNLVSGNAHEGFSITDAGTMYNLVTGNYIGISNSGTSSLGNGEHGVSLGGGTTLNTIGGDIPDERNLISGNDGHGVRIEGVGTMSNTVSGNYIGTDINGTAAIPNHDWAGVLIGDGATYNIVGGNTPGERNIISGNDIDGVVIIDSNTMSNTIIGNYIGTDVNGTTALGNGESGVSIAGSDYNTVGGDTSAERNLLSGNRDGILFEAASHNKIIGNYIGTDAGGNAAVPNIDDGLRVKDESSYNLFKGNLISGNAEGFRLTGSQSTNNTIIGNYIGTNANGTVALGNDADGIVLGDGTTYNTIGGDNATPGGACTDECNLISNNEIGVSLEGSGTNSNTVSGNYIGTDVNGTAPLGNRDGVAIQEPSYNVIGGDTQAERNLISGNDYGIAVVFSAAHNTIKGNYIGTDASGTADLGNLSYGVMFHWGAHDNLAENNLIAYTKYFTDTRPGPGILVLHDTSINNTLRQNRIHSNFEKGILLRDGGNQELFPPILTNVSNNSVSGQAPPNSIVEIFSDNEDEGRYYHGFTLANASGNFIYTQASVFTGTNVTATATDSDGNTSEFSSGYEPLVDVEVVAILQPKDFGKQDKAITPTVKIGNAGTTVETGIEMTVEAGGSALSGSYGPHQITTELPALGYATLTFPQLTPNSSGSYIFTATVNLAGDQDSSNDILTQSVQIASTVVDLWTKDSTYDTGDIPTNNFWQSPDIWVRHNNDSGTEHQDPIAGQTNYVYMIVRNRGDEASNAGDTIRVYWHEPSLGIKCGDWALIDTVTTGSILPNGTQLLTFTWTPSRSGHTCLHGEISSADDPVVNQCDVPWDNNLSQRNVEIIPGGSGIDSQAAGGIEFEVTNIKDAPKPVDIIVDVSDVPDANAVRLDLGSELANRWASVDGKSKSEGIDWVSGSIITITNSQSGTIAGIPMGASESQTVTLLVNAPSVETTTVTVYQAIDAGPGVAAADAIVGGNTYIFTKASNIYLPVIFKNN